MNLESILLGLGLTPEQHAKRRLGIGGSDAGYIVAGGEAWRQLWLEKTGRVQPNDLSNVLAVCMGQWTELLNLAWYEKQTGRPITRCREQLTHPTHSYMRVTLDGFDEAFQAPVNAKHVARSDEAMELRYTAQGHHEAIVTGCERYVFSVFVGSNRWELYEKEVDPFFAAEYQALCEEFWSYVAADKEPPEPEPLPVPPPRLLRTVDMSQSNMWVTNAAEWLLTKPAAKRHAAALGILKGLVDEDVGLATGAGVQVKRGKNNALYISEAK